MRYSTFNGKKAHITMRYLSCFAIFLLIFGFACNSPAFAEQFMGGNSQQYSTSALTLPPGTKTYVIHSRAHMFNVEGASWSGLTGAASYNFGFTRNVELEISSILYQDLNLSLVNRDGDVQNTNVPDRLMFRWKWGNKQLGSNPFYIGAQGTLNSRLSSGAVSNVHMEPYYSDKMSYQVNFLFSYIGNPLYPDDALQIHYNLGYINYNDAGQMGKSTDAVKIYCAYVFPINARLVAALESQGTYFLGYPDFADEIFSIEEFGYVTPSIRWQLVPGIVFMSGVDIKIYDKTGDANITDPLIQPEEFPNYPSWRITSKIIIQGSSVAGPGYASGSYQGGAPGGGMPMAPGAYGAGNRSALYDWGGSVKDDVQYIEVELEKIREDRRKAEEKLNKIKNKIKKK